MSLACARFPFAHVPRRCPAEPAAGGLAGRVGYRYPALFGRATPILVCGDIVAPQGDVARTFGQQPDRSHAEISERKLVAGSFPVVYQMRPASVQCADPRPGYGWAFHGLSLRRAACIVGAPECVSYRKKARYGRITDSCRPRHPRTGWRRRYRSSLADFRSGDRSGGEPIGRRRRRRTFPCP